MSTSGSSNFSQNCNEIILDSLQLLTVYGIGRTVTENDMSYCRRQLNRMVKSWSVNGPHLWAKEEGVLYLDQYTAKYSLGNGATDSYTTLTSSQHSTQLNGALAASATSVTVDSTTGMTVGDKIGIVLTSKDIHWTTIATIPTSTTLTLTTGAASAASDNALVYTFTNRLYKPLRIKEARCVSGFDSGSTSTKTTIPMTIIPYDTYQRLVNKEANGTPIQLCYNPKLSNGNMYVWPRPADCSFRIEFSYDRLIEDLDTATDDFDFPPEWYDPLVWQLALRIAPAFGKDEKLQLIVGPAAIGMLDELKSWDSEITEVTISPDNGGA